MRAAHWPNATPRPPRSSWLPDRLHVLAVLLPPLAVKRCGRGDQLPLNILLTLLLWLPGVIHAMSIVSSHQADVQARGIVSALRSHIGH